MGQGDLRNNHPVAQEKRDRIRAAAADACAALDRIEADPGQTGEANAGKKDLDLAVRKLMRDSGVRRVGALGPA